MQLHFKMKDYSINNVYLKLYISFQVDVTTGKVIYWMQDNVYCAEAQFVPRPKRYASENLEEDEGVIISSLIKGKLSLW